MRRTSKIELISLVLLAGGCGGASESPRPALRDDEVADQREARRRSEFREVTTGAAHSCAISVEGTVACWGDNALGQLGDGTEEERLTPVWVERIDNAIDVDAGMSSTCALHEGGGASCWGGSASALRPPTALEGIHGVIRSIAVGRTVCAIDLPGRVFCWPNAEGIASGRPVELAPRNPARYLDVGLDWLCTLSGPDDGQCFTFSAAEDDPERLTFGEDDVVLELDDVRQLAVSGHQACATGHGRAVCWGHNDHGQLGTGDLEARVQPVRILDGVDVTHVTTGWQHSCATTAAGGVKCWGDNSFGQLGDGTMEQRTEPVDVIGLEQGVVRVAAGRGHTCAVTIGREVYCWGQNDHGQLGDGTRALRTTPVAVDVSSLR